MTNLHSLIGYQQPDIKVGEKLVAILFYFRGGVVFIWAGTPVQLLAGGQQALHKSLSKHTVDSLQL